MELGKWKMVNIAKASDQFTINQKNVFYVRN